MVDKNSIDTLKEQISFLEARIGRYDDLVTGSVFKRILFGGGRQTKICLIGIIFSLILCGYALFRHSTGFIFVFILSLLVLAYLSVQLNVIRKKNGPEKYQKMITSLTNEKASMEKELKRLEQEKTTASK